MMINISFCTDILSGDQVLPSFFSLRFDFIPGIIPSWSTKSLGLGSGSTPQVICSLSTKSHRLRLAQNLLLLFSPTPPRTFQEGSYLTSLAFLWPFSLVSWLYLQPSLVELEEPLTSSPCSYTVRIWFM